MCTSGFDNTKAEVSGLTPYWDYWVEVRAITEEGDSSQNVTEPVTTNYTSMYAFSYGLVHE